MLMVLVGGGETATKTGWESAARDDERRCDDPWTLGIDKSGKKKIYIHTGAHKHRVPMQHVTI
jgi:hypothetical protein